MWALTREERDADDWDGTIWAGSKEARQERHFLESSSQRSSSLETANESHIHKVLRVDVTIPNKQIKNYLDTLVT